MLLNFTCTNTYFLEAALINPTLPLNSWSPEDPRASGFHLPKRWPGSDPLGRTVRTRFHAYVQWRHPAKSNQNKTTAWPADPVSLWQWACHWEKLPHCLCPRKVTQIQFKPFLLLWDSHKQNRHKTGEDLSTKDMLSHEVELYLVMTPLSHLCMKCFWTGDQGCFCFGNKRFWDIPDLYRAVLAAGHHEAFFHSEREKRINCEKAKQWLPLHQKRAFSPLGIYPHSDTLLSC